MLKPMLDFDDWLEVLHVNARGLNREQELNVLSRSVLKAFFDIECAPTVAAILGECQGIDTQFPMAA